MMIPEKKIYPRSNDTQTVYLKKVVTDPNIEVGDYTIYNDFAHDPQEFQQNNVLYHYPHQSRQTNYREILLHCLRGKVPVYQRQSYNAVAFHLPLSDFF